MRTWMLSLVFPVGLLVTVAVVSLTPSSVATVLAVVWVWVAFPAGVTYVRRRARGTRSEDIEGGYWRTKLL